MGLLAAWLVATAPAAAVALDQISPQTQAVDALIQAEMRERRIPGLQVAVVRNGEIVLERSYGLANLQTPVPVTDETVFSINSITKIFTGVEAMRLVEQGKLDLSAPVSTYLDDLPPAWRAVTIKQLLSHMSGLPDIVDPNTGKTIGDGTDAGAWAEVIASPIRFPPGEKTNYNQTNYLLMQRVIEKLGGRPFTEAVAEHQFAVAGMPHSGFGDSRDVIPGKAQSYRFYRDAWGDAGVLRNVYEEFPPNQRAAAGLNSTAGDMARWAVAVQQGRILKPESLRTMWTQTLLNDGKAGDWALGWTWRGAAPHRTIGLTGGGRAAFRLYPEDDLAVVILTNLSGATPEEITPAVAAIYIPSVKTDGVAPLRTELASRGYAQARSAYEALKRKTPGFSISENDLNNWGYRLLRIDRGADAVEIFKLAVALYPQSANTYDSLGDAYDRIGRPTSAIENFRRSLVMNPKNDHARKRLEKLGAPAAP
ncbi:hypothetical protein CSW64_09690 [Caulobacter mirabilis]|uniref:Beta-lactamase-related domain-containing protein n=2 Tax=Caulobacter mirabilis TaxID=69666 RepID=A0A2D2AXD6_9CAUL|nr:hypothetical protein CSW64_09690 [Caulobacter mirabilis]